MTKIRAAITGVMGYVPEDVLSNKDLDKLVNTNEEWDLTRPGNHNSRLPQWEGRGGPEKSGQISPAAFPNTVNAMSISGEPGMVNSSQLLDRKSAVSIDLAAKSRNAPGCGSPLGLLPALNARICGAPNWLIMASPKMLRAELPVHNTKMLIITHSLSVQLSTIQGAAGYAAASCCFPLALQGRSRDRDRTVCLITTICQNIRNQHISCPIICATHTYLVLSVLTD